MFRIAVSRILPTGIIILSSTILFFLLQTFYLVQTATLLEGNKLYSSQAAFTDDHPEVACENIAKLESDAHVFGVLSTGSDERVLYAADYSQINFPLHDGKGFTNTNIKEALAGAKVDTVEKDGKHYYVFNSVMYEIVGTLGRESSSLLQNSIILKDPSLFKTELISSVIVDGADIRNRYARLSPSASLEFFDFRVDRRTILDSVSPVIFGAGGLLIVLGFICGGFLYGERKTSEVRIKHLLGLPRWKSYFSQAAMFALLIIAAIVICIFFGSYFGYGYSVFDVRVVFFAIACFVLSFVSSVIPFLKKGRA